MPRAKVDSQSDFAQLEMLRRENEDLCTKLDAVTAHLRAKNPAVSAIAAKRLGSTFNKPGKPGASINSQPGKVSKIAKGKELLLVFEGSIGSCDRCLQLTPDTH